MTNILVWNDEGVPGGIVHDYLATGSTHDMVVLRYNGDGTLDTNFGGGDGTAVVDFPSWYPGKQMSGGNWNTIFAHTSDDYASDIKIDPSGRIVISGTSITRDVHTLRLYPSGPDGTPYLSPTLDITYAFAVARLNSDGSPDTTFGDDTFRDGVRDGTVLSYPAYEEGNNWYAEFGTAVEIDSNNRIVLAGAATTQSSNSSDFAVLRYTATGELDATFSVDGFTIANMQSDSYGLASTEIPDAMVLDSQGRIVVLGRSIYKTYPSEYEILEQESAVLVRFTSTGVLDENFGIQGMSTIATGARYDNQLWDMAIDTNDRFLEVGYTTVGYYEDGSPRISGLLARQQPDGTIDEHFGDAGVINSNFNGDEAEIGSVALDSNGRIVVTGTAYRLEEGSWHEDGILARYLDLDSDGDGIENNVDVQPNVFSNDFSDVALGGATAGTITNRGNGETTVADSPDPTRGLRITTESAADFSVPGALITVPGPGQFEVTHGSVILDVLLGTLEASFIADSGQVAFTSLSAGNGLIFEPDTFTFEAPASNSQTVNVQSGGSEISVNAGTVVRPVQIQVMSGDAAVNLASNGILSLTIFSTVGFTASQVNIGSVMFAGAHAMQSSFNDVNGDGRLDLVLKFRTQDTTLRALYSQLLADDINDDGILDSNHQTADVSLTGETVDHVLICGFDSLDLFLSGKKLRSLLDQLAAARVL